MPFPRIVVVGKGIFVYTKIFFRLTEFFLCIYEKIFLLIRTVMCAYFGHIINSKYSIKVVLKINDFEVGMTQPKGFFADLFY
ncbi:hypothetical protein SAMN02745171_00978 [Porphyromonas circumdentaria]|uniref:Uncharacterized protein n=1 Tax=Porphyromonas circumdentaria TaxID=29524 RepID=A0A1T4N1F3_9PORP|nr:hypothetical protein [Porphyromonas circumdentaria]SJZ72971.1 hypothetical protein SAMN02745171_00978 [Porphyromonas circumdentaria]